MRELLMMAHIIRRGWQGANTFRVAENNGLFGAVIAHL